MSQRIRVLMCCSDLDRVKGGMVTLVRDYLQYKGWHSRFTFVATHVEGSAVRKILIFARAYIKIMLLLLGRKVDLAHLHVAERGSFYRKAFLLKLCHRFGVPVIFHHHGAEFEDFYHSLNAGKKRYVVRMLEEADCNLVLSQLLKKELLKKAPHARVKVLHNAVDVPEGRTYSPSANRILMLGRQGARKGSYDLLEAVAQIDDRLPEHIRLWLCGDGEVEQVKKKAQELGIAGRLAFAGWVDGSQKEKCLMNAMMHVLPSYREALPMSILETMARGIPNISTDIASVPEVIEDGENGLLIHPGEVRRLGEKILLLAENEALREKLSRQSHKRIRESFSLEACVDRLEKIYRGLLSK